VLAILPDYRLYPQVRFPAFVEDAAAAVAWARKHAAEFGGDPQRIFLAGHSAGAHMIALLGTDARYLAPHGLHPRDLRGVIGIAGPYDFLPLTADDLIDMFSSDPALQAQSQPVNFVDGDEPPFLLLHGDSDLLVWNRNSERLKARFDAIGGRAEHRVYPGVGHIRILASLRYPALAPTREHLLDFIERESATTTQGAAR
jgi:acetyl esterase/lipase